MTTKQEMWVPNIQQWLKNGSQNGTDRKADNFGTGWERESELENQMEDGRLRVEVEKLGVAEKVQATELMRTYERALIEQGDQTL